MFVNGHGWGGGENLFLTLADFLRTTAFFGLLALFCMLAIRFLRARIARLLHRGWFSSAFFSAGLLFFAISALLYLVPWQWSVDEFNQSGARLPESQLPTPQEQLGIYWVVFVRVLSTSLVLSLLSLPLIFIGAFVLSHFIQKRKLSPVVAYPLTALAAGFFALVLFMAFPFLLTSLFYLLYWGFPG